MAYIQTYSSSKKKCNRKYMEDYYNVYFCFKNNCWVFNICDGHGGFEVAEYVNEHFKLKIIEILETFNKNNEMFNKNKFKNEIVKMVELLDTNVSKLSCAEYTGSTLVSVVCFNDIFFFINVGDSNIICNMQTPYFNKLHVPTDEDEKNRITKSSYIQNERIEGVINLSRAFGDFRFKHSDKTKSPMISTPDVDIIDIKKIYKYNDKPWIFLSSDGLLILFSRSEIRNIINFYFDFGYNCDEIVKLFMNYCSFHNNDDNVAIILIFLENKHKKENNNKEILNNIKKSIKKYCLEGVNQNKKIKWRVFLQIVKEEILYEFKDVKNLNHIYKLLEFEVISKIPEIKF